MSAQHGHAANLSRGGLGQGWQRAAAALTAAPVLIKRVMTPGPYHAKPSPALPHFETTSMTKPMQEGKHRAGCQAFHSLLHERVSALKPKP